jgi:hypothetical protein
VWDLQRLTFFYSTSLPPQTDSWATPAGPYSVQLLAFPGHIACVCWRLPPALLTHPSSCLSCEVDAIVSSIPWGRKVRHRDTQQITNYSSSTGISAQAAWPQSLWGFYPHPLLPCTTLCVPEKELSPTYSSFSESIMEGVNLLKVHCLHEWDYIIDIW